MITFSVLAAVAAYLLSALSPGPARHACGGSCRRATTGAQT